MDQSDSLPQNISGEALVELLIGGARFDDAEDVQTALDGRVNVNSTDSNGRTGEKRSNCASQIIDAESRA